WAGLFFITNERKVSCTYSAKMEFCRLSRIGLSRTCSWCGRLRVRTLPGTGPRPRSLKCPRPTIAFARHCHVEVAARIAHAVAAIEYDKVKPIAGKARSHTFFQVWDTMMALQDATQ